MHPPFPVDSGCVARLSTMVQAVVKRSHGTKKVKKALTFSIDCSKPVEDKIMEIASFEKFLLDRIKVAGKTGEWGGDLGGQGVCAMLCLASSSV